MFAEITQIHENVKEARAGQAAQDQDGDQIQKEGFADPAPADGEPCYLKRGQKGERHHRPVSPDGERPDVKKNWKHTYTFFLHSPIIRLAVPTEIAESAKLKTGQTRKSRKSITCP